MNEDDDKSRPTPENDLKLEAARARREAAEAAREITRELEARLAVLPPLSLPEPPDDRTLLAEAIHLNAKPTAAPACEALIREGKITVHGVASDGSRLLPAEGPWLPIAPEAWPAYAIEWVRGAAVLVEEGPHPPSAPASPRPDPRSLSPRAHGEQHSAYTRQENAR